MSPGLSLGAPRLDHAARWVLLAALLTIGFLETWVRIVLEQGAGAGSAVLLAPVLGAALTAVALTLQRRPELPIHDRQSDKIVGTTVLTIALMVQWLVLPRYAGSYVLLHLDVLAAWVFLLGGCVFLFGLRRTGAFWPAWIVLLVPPGAVRLASYAFGGGEWSQVAMAAFVAVVGPVAVSAPGVVRRLRRPDPGGAPGSHGGHSRSPATVVSRREAWRSAPLLIVVALLLGVAPLPQGIADRLAVGPPALDGPGQVIPEGWQQMDTVDYPWAGQLFGPSATLHRQMIRATRVRADWDELLRPRVAAVQSLTVSDTGVLEVFPLETTFDLSEARVSPPRTVDLGREVTARYRTVIDDGNLLTWSLLTFVWSRSGDRVQRVTLITVDNHEFDAEFPETVPGTRSTFARMVNLLLRGSAAVIDTNPQDKDLDMLIELGTDLVEAQWTSE
ncbi:hypothetical protein [Dietzia psychralcaliphila]|uniref:hypothetical protein n=1 Tax=Dietzia psychralcaliphila TaxID=139021 RepID=UPI000D4E2B40|nr:hypothetical protein [Dietzia psychralcaliphila]PTM85911.1 hypothetical protein C8N39_10992 [Dietzia psychralcaliphila]